MLETMILELLFMFLTGASYLLARKLYGKFRRPYFHTILVSVVFIIIFLALFKIDYNIYYTNTRVLKFVLNVSVVAFGYLLYLNLDFLKKNAGIILLANFIGSLIGVLSVLGITWLLGTGSAVASSLVPKSITTPLAVEISSRLGGITSLTAVTVVLCGLFGAIIGPQVFRWFKIKSSFARGIALGTSAHGIGTAKALEMGALEGAIGGLSIGLMGFFTSLIISIIL